MKVRCFERLCIGVTCYLGTAKYRQAQGPECRPDPDRPTTRNHQDVLKTSVCSYLLCLASRGHSPPNTNVSSCPSNNLQVRKSLSLSQFFSLSPLHLLTVQTFTKHLLGAGPL